MAKKKGHIDINHDIAEALMKINLSGYQYRIIWAIFRKTYGWHKSTDKISFTQFEKMTGLKRWHIERAVEKLETLNIIIIDRNNRINKYKFNSNYDTWKTDTITKIGYDNDISKIGYKVYPKEVTKLLPKEVITKEKKETIQKKEKNALYEAYQREEKWNEIKEKRTDTIPDAINERIMRAIK